MRLFGLRKELKQVFNNNNIDEADADFIISEVLGVKRTELALIDNISEEIESEIRSKSEMRLNNVPVDSIFNKAYFYGLEFRVNDDVLTPRPESELIIDYAINAVKENGYKSALDMCTGSGCLAIALKKNVDIDITAVDISTKALQLAKHNAKINEMNIEFVRSNMFEKIEDKFDLIISNPPYIDSDEVKELDREVIEHDPILALDGGAMGLKFYNIIHDNMKKHLNDNGMLIMEIGEDQKEMILNMFADCHFVQCIQDYAGLDRVMIFKK
ncbi:MAG: peptide chain release factor N(5)-glutamine methyltransferase [Clostridia bacterium]